MLWYFGSHPDQASRAFMSLSKYHKKQFWLNDPPTVQCLLILLHNSIAAVTADLARSIGRSGLLSMDKDLAKRVFQLLTAPEAARDLLTLYTAKQAALAWESTRKAAGDLAGTKIRIQPEEIRRSDVKNARGEATLIATIFSGKEFDASKIDIASVRLGPGYLRCDK
jgi:hypothetical protein